MKMTSTLHAALSMYRNQLEKHKDKDESDSDEESD